MSEELLTASVSRLEDLLAPINGGVGDDVSYDEKFEAIKLEIDKLSSLAGDACNWGSVATMSEEILLEKSKDFRIGCYLACCRMREGDLEKVLDGLVLLQEMCSRFWDDMYPPLRRIRARAGMIGWMSDQSADLVLGIKPKAADGPIVKLIDETSSKLDQNFREKFGEHYPGMPKLRDGIRNLARSVPKEAPKPPPPPPKEERAASGADTPQPPPIIMSAPGGPTAENVVTAEDARNAMEPTWLLMRKMGGCLRAEKPENPLAYKLTRMGMWMELTALPVVQNGVTLVPAPGSHIKQRLESLAASQDWLTLLNEADDVGTEYILWLDPQRFVSMAMSALGALFMKTKDELLLQTALMLKKVPALPTLNFADGTPYADGQTQMWIDGEVKPMLASGGDGGGGGGAVASVLDEPIKEAKDHAMKGDLGKAIQVVASATDAAPTPVDRFRGKLAIAQLCLQAGQLAIARGQLDGLTEVIRKHELAKWDPRLCAEVYAALYAAIRGLNSGGAITEAADKAAEMAAFEQLCQLDPATALKLAPKTG